MRTAYELSDWQKYLTHGEIDVLQECVSEFYNPVVINIGAGAGTSTIAFLEKNPNAVVFSVDILTDEREITTNEHLRLDECGDDYLSRTKKIWGDSKVVGKNWPYPVDIVFVDGDHSPEGCLGDLEVWMPSIMSGGYIIFHDYGSPNWPGVKDVVDAIMEKEVGLGLAEKVFQVDTVIAYKII